MSKKQSKPKAVIIKVCADCGGRGLIGHNELAVSCEKCNGSGQIKE